MMWNFLAGVLLTDASIILDGSPGHPDMGVLWDLAANAGMTCTDQPSYVAACMKAEVEPGPGASSRLRSVGSTGSPLAPEGFQWIYDHVGADTWLFSTSGGTDVCTAFVGGVPILPVYRGELQARSLGCAVEAFDEDGNAVIDEVGELVLTEPLPSMPLFLWGDEDGSRYPRLLLRHVSGRLAPRRLDRDHLSRHRDHLRALGFDHQPRRGAHGDERDLPRRRLRAGGHRRIVVDIPRPGTGLDALFVVLRDGVELSDELRGRARPPDPRALAATCPTRSTRSPRSRARSRARCSRCP